MARFQDVSPRLDPLAIIHVDQPADGLEERVKYSGQAGALLEPGPPAKFGKTVS